MTIEDLLIIHEITQLKYRYMRAVDTQDWDLMATVFAKNARTWYDSGTLSATGRENIILRGLYMDIHPRHMRERIEQIAEFTDPLQMVPARQQDLGIDGALRLEHGTAKIAAPHAELDRHIALLLLAIDEGGTRYQSHFRHVLERDLNDAATRTCGRGDRDAPDRIEILPKRHGQTHHHREVAIAAAFVKIAGALPPDRRLHDGIDVAGRQSEAGGTRPIDIYSNGRLPQ